MTQNTSKSRVGQGKPLIGASSSINGAAASNGAALNGAAVNGAGHLPTLHMQEEQSPALPTQEEQSPALPTVDDAELAALVQKYGAPLHRTITLPADESTRTYRFGSRSDRRAEVVFAIEDPTGGIWVHAKAHYPRHLFRLPSGGVHWDEGVEAALLREIEEETALTVQVERFLGLIEYLFLYDGRQAPFASYVFLVRSAGGLPTPHAGEAITDFQLAPVQQLGRLAAELRSLGGDRGTWGQWRAMAHELACETLTPANRAHA